MQPERTDETVDFAAVPRDCVLFSTADWRAPYWTNKQHTARQLAATGRRVLYVESIGLRTPGANARDFKRLWLRLRRGLAPVREVEPGVWLLSPLAVPFKQHWAAVRLLNQGLLALRIRWAMLRIGMRRPLVWTYHPFMLQALDLLPHRGLVYHCVDDLAAVPGIPAEPFRAEERKLLARCDAVFVTSAALLGLCKPHNPHTWYFPNVVDAEHFGKALQPGPIPEDLARIPEPRLAYIGALSDYKVDFALLHACASAHPEWQWVLIGEEREGQHDPSLAAMLALPNVHLLGHRDYARLPDYLRGISVGLLPTLVNEYTRSMFPMKYFEYIAAGRRVVSTPLEFTRHEGTALEIGGEDEAFAGAIARSLTRPRLSATEADAAVGDNTWAVRLDKMIALVATALRDADSGTAA